MENIDIMKKENNDLKEKLLILDLIKIYNIFYSTYSAWKNFNILCSSFSL